MAGQPSLIEYPCDFPIKIMGRMDTSSLQPAVCSERAAQDFSQAVLTIVRRHAPDFDAAAMETRSSKKGAYLSLTCTIRAVSRDQLDALYQELCDHPLVVMAL